MAVVSVLRISYCVMALMRATQYALQGGALC
jgi:hypothetical protein